MQRFLKISILFFGLIMIANAAMAQSPQWFKGNLHTHSYWSDGNDFPEMIMNWYKNNGYEFVALSDHNILAEGEKWVEIPKGEKAEKSFRQYLEKYGEEWVEYEENVNKYRVRLKTLGEYRTLFEQRGEFLVIKSEEITDGYKGKPIHVNATNIQEFIEPQGGNSVVDVMQNNINAVLKQRKSTGEPMFPHINHPNFGWSVTAEDLKQLEGERFFEVYNGHPLVHNEGDSLRSGTEEMWDQVNIHYLQHGKPLILGIAVDDAHHYHEFSSRQSNPGRGWIQVKSSSLTPDALIAAMEQGNFYASTGVRLKDVHFDGQSLIIEVDAEEGVQYETEFIGVMENAKSEGARVLKREQGASASYTLSGNEMFVRAKITSDKPKQNGFTNSEYEVAWVQPVLGKKYQK